MFLKNNIAYQNQTLSPEKLPADTQKKTQDNGWSYCKQLQEMHVRTLPKTAVYQGQVNKGRVLPRHCYKERKDLLINDVASPK